MKLPFTIQLDKDVRADFERVADAGHMEATKYLAVWANELSQVKPEFALRVLGLIPDEWKKRRPGRPSAGTRIPDSSAAAAEVTAQNVA